jgi:hypothetical protein
VAGGGVEDGGGRQRHRGQADDEDGATAETTVRLTLEAVLRDDDGEVVAETTAEPTFVVRVTNGEVTIEVTGSMNPAVRTEDDD